MPTMPTSNPDGGGATGPRGNANSVTFNGVVYQNSPTRNEGDKTYTVENGKLLEHTWMTTATIDKYYQKQIAEDNARYMRMMVKDLRQERARLYAAAAEHAYKALYDACTNDGQRAAVESIASEFKGAYRGGKWEDATSFRNRWNTRINQVMGL